MGILDKHISTEADVESAVCPALLRFDEFQVDTVRGLLLRVTADGAKTWRRTPGIAGPATIGQWPEMSLDAAVSAISERVLGKPKPPPKDMRRAARRQADDEEVARAVRTALYGAPQKHPWSDAQIDNWLRKHRVAIQRMSSTTARGNDRWKCCKVNPEGNECDYVWTASWEKIRKNPRCPVCGNASGYSSHKPGRLYVLAVRVRGRANPVPKIGITNLTVAQCYAAEQSAYEIVLDVLFNDGRVAKAIETHVKERYRDQRWASAPVLTTRSTTELFDLPVEHIVKAAQRMILWRRGNPRPSALLKLPKVQRQKIEPTSYECPPKPPENAAYREFRDFGDQTLPEPLRPHWNRRF